jgi:hypothetical protein
MLDLQNDYSGSILLFNQNIRKKNESNKLMIAFSNDIVSKILIGVHKENLKYKNDII